MTAAKKTFLIPLILLIVLCTALAAMVGYIFILFRQDAAYTPYLATPAPRVLQETPVAEAAQTAIPSNTAVTPVPAAAATPAPQWQFSGNDDRYWNDGALSASDGYRSPDLSVQVRTVVDTTTFDRRITYYVADIYVRDVTLIRTENYRSDFTRSGHGKVERIAKNANALVAISGDYCGYHRDSLVIRNGQVYRKQLRDDMDICLLLRDGTMETYRAGTITLRSILEKDIWQAWQFGPALLKSNGDVRTSFLDSTIGASNPRSCIGYCEPGHYLFVVVDGRQKQSRGLTLKELARLMKSLDCTQAFNLDGGASAHFFWKDRIFNKPSKGGREMSDIIYVAKEDYRASPYYHGKDGIRK